KGAGSGDAGSHNGRACPPRTLKSRANGRRLKPRDMESPKPSLPSRGAPARSGGAVLAPHSPWTKPPVRAGGFFVQERRRAAQEVIVMLVQVRRAYSGAEGKRVRIGTRLWVAKDSKSKAPDGVQTI